MEFISPSVNPESIKLLTFDEMDEDFKFANRDSDASTQEEKQSLVLRSSIYAVKIMQDHDPDLANELHVGSKLNELIKQTQIFNYTSGYILSLDLPPSTTLDPISRYDEDEEDYLHEYAHHYVYVFSQLLDKPFNQLPDEPKVNEDFYFEILIGLLYARRAFNFCHWDLHEQNLMYNVSKTKKDRAYWISDFYVTISGTVIEPKLIDYGKSVLDENYSDDKWKEARFKKFWNKSDIYHLSLIFSHRRNLSVKFRDFLEVEVLPAYLSSMYARTLQKDSASNHANIEALLRSYFDTSITGLICSQCSRVGAEYKDVNGFFCGIPCQTKYYYE